MTKWTVELRNGRGRVLAAVEIEADGQYRAAYAAVAQLAPSQRLSGQPIHHVDGSVDYSILYAHPRRTVVVRPIR